MTYEVGRVYNRRRDIHGRYGGQRQGGISTPSNAPFVILFTGQSGTQYGYQDRWTEEGVFLYSGEGQRDDMAFVRGNLAIRDHAANGKDLLLFEALGKRRGVRFMGNFACVSWDTEEGPDVEGNTREVIVFHLVPADADTIETDETMEPGVSLANLRQMALASSTTAPSSDPKSAKRVYHQRSQAVRTYVLARASGNCESCGATAPFTRRDGTPYLEPHHTRRLSDGGPDHPRWVGAVCPNCHREIHHGQDGGALNERLEDYLGSIELT